MKKILAKTVVYLLTFIIFVLIFGKFMGRRQTNNTAPLDPASQPVIYMSIGDITYNMLRGFSSARDISYNRDSLTYLDDNRTVPIEIVTYGQKIDLVRYELRNIEDGRLIEEGELETSLSSIGNLTGKISLKDLIIPEAEYSLLIDLKTGDERDIYYYTRVKSGDNKLAYDKISYARYFHDALFDKKEAENIKKHLETNSSLNDNSTFAYVDIHSSFSQITYGDLELTPYGDPLIYLKEDTGNTASICIEYLLRNGFGLTLTAYKAKESITVRYTDKGFFIMSYIREMETIANPADMCVNDKIILGIADEKPEMMESENGTCVAFVSGGRLFVYNESSGKLACVYTFYDYGVFDTRNICDDHGIRILSVGEDGNAVFAVYGYMNRGKHEGDVGICIYEYDDRINSISELLYIPYEKSSDILMEEMSRLLYMNSLHHIYMTMENSVFRIDLDDKVIKTTGMYWSGNTLQTSDDQRLIVTMGSDPGTLVSELTVTDLENEQSVKVSAGSAEYIRFLGFIGEDMIYGVARQGDVLREASGNVLFPMYRVCICDGTGRLLKHYEKEGLYVTDALINENQIVLSRISAVQDRFVSADDDTITAEKEDDTGRNYLSVAVIDRFERYVQIQTKNEIRKNLKVTTPKEILSEEVMVLDPGLAGNVKRYYVYDAFGMRGIYVTEAAAVEGAYRCGGSAVTENGNVIWKYASRKNVNQIMSITAEAVEEGESPLSVCMDVMMGCEGVIRNSEVLLAEGGSVTGILSQNMPDVTVLDLTGCTTDMLMYYLDRDIPVMALLQDGGAVLITGHNEKEFVIMDPSSGELYKKDITKMAEIFENSGNQFITYAYAGSETWAVKTA